MTTPATLTRFFRYLTMQFRLGLCWFISLALLGCDSSKKPSIHFKAAANIPTESPAVDKHGKPLPKSLKLAGHGVAVLDANLDGRLDLVIVNGKPYYFVVLNTASPDGKPQFSSKAVYIGVEDDNKTNEPRSVHSHDFDNDGALDIYLCNAGKGTLSAKNWQDLKNIHAPENLIDRGLFRDAKFRTQISRGDGTFEYKDIGGDGEGNTRSSLFADFDGDGYFDCFLSNSAYFGIWNAGSSTPNMLLPGKKGGFGANILDSAVVDAPPGRFKDEYGRSTKCFKGAVVRDFDGDGKPDIISGSYPDPKRYANPAGAEIDLDGDGLPDGGFQGDWEGGTLVLHNISEPGKIRFRDVSLAAIDNGLGVDNPMNSHAPVPADLDADGDFDLLMGAGRPYRPSLARAYRNDSKPGEIRFTNVTKEAGLDFLNHLETLPPPYGSHGGKPFGKPITPRFDTSLAADIDNDGDLDWITCNRVPFREAEGTSFMFVFINDGRGHFTLVPAEEHGLNTTARDLSYGDFDNDGRIDLVTVSGHGPAKWDRFHNKNQIFLNRTQTRYHFIEIDVTSKENRLGIGTKITVFKAGTNKILGHDEVRTDFAYRSSRAPRLHFGLGKVKEVDIRYQCRNGDKGIRKGVKGDQIYQLDMDSESD